MKLLSRFADHSWKEGRFLGVEEFQLHGVALILLVALLGWKLGYPLGILAWIAIGCIILVLVWPELQKEGGLFWSQGSSSNELNGKLSQKGNNLIRNTSSQSENAELDQHISHGASYSDHVDDEFSATRSRRTKRVSAYNSRLSDLYIDLSFNQYKQLLDKDCAFEFSPEPVIGSAKALEDLTFALIPKEKSAPSVKQPRLHDSQARATLRMLPSSHQQRQTIRESFTSWQISQSELVEEIAQDVLCQTGIMSLEALATAYKLDPRELKLLNEGAKKPAGADAGNKAKEGTEAATKPLFTLGQPIQPMGNPPPSVSHPAPTEVNTRKAVHHQGTLPTILESKNENMPSLNLSNPKGPGSLELTSNVSFMNNGSTKAQPSVSSLFQGAGSTPAAAALAGGIFGSTPTVPSPSAAKPQPPVQPAPTQTKPPAPVATPQPVASPIPAPTSTPRGPSNSRLTVSEDAIKQNRTAFLELTSQSKPFGESNKSRAEETKARILLFNNQIANQVDSHFLGQCQGIITELDNRKADQQDYCYFIREFLVQIYTASLQEFKNNRVKYVYLGVFLHIVSLYHPLLMEVAFAITHKKYPFIAGIKVSIQDDREKYLMELGFEIKPTLNPNSFREKKAYLAKVGSRLLEGSDKKLLEVFMEKLDIYSLIYFNILATDLKTQLQPIYTADYPNPQQRQETISFADKIISLKKVDYTPMYFQAPRDFLSACPIYFLPILLKNWMSVSSDMWQVNSAKMRQISQKLYKDFVQPLSKKLEDPQLDFDVFSEKLVKKEINISRIMMERLYKDIEKNSTIASRYVLADPENN